MEMKQMTVEELSKLTASNAPAPGGGSISALAGACGAALASMVANLTIGKKNFEGVQAEMERIVARAEQIRAELLDEMQRDTAAFDAVMAAMALPKSTDEEKAKRREAIQSAMKGAAEVPLGVAERAASILPLAKDAVQLGNRNAVTDGLVGAMMARTAVLGALFNVKVNLASISDEAYVAEMRERCDALRDFALRAEAEVLALAPELA